jgi:large conductance mechanosensitive channel
MFKEFKEFALKGNLVDLAVAFVMGAAFNKLTTSFIDGIIMPLVGKVTAGVDFKSLRIVLTDAKLDATGTVLTPETAIKYGDFLAVSIDFFLVAMFMFFLVKAMNKMRKQATATENK